MRNTSLGRLAGSAAIPVAAILASLPVWAMAQSGPSIAGPSVVRTAEMVVFTGRGFAADSPLSFAVVAPGGAESVYGAVASAQGTVSYQVSPRVAGAHTLKVLDTSGQVLATVKFIVME